MLDNSKQQQKFQLYEVLYQISFQFELLMPMKTEEVLIICHLDSKIDDNFSGNISRIVTECINN